MQTKKGPLLSPIMRWFLFAMVLANIVGQMSPMLMPIYLTELRPTGERFGSSVPFMITAVAAFLTIIPIWFTFKLPEKEEEPSPITAD